MTSGVAPAGAAARQRASAAASPATRLSGLRLDPWLIGLLLLEAVFLLPVLRTGYLGDDSLNSLINGQLGLSHEGIVSYLVNFNASFVNVLGRLEPLALLHDYAVLHFIHSLLLYKAYLLLLTVGATALFAYVIGQLGAPRYVVYASVMFTLACFQLRLYHESLVSYGGLVQAVLIYLLGMTLCFHRYLHDGRRRWMFGAVLLYVAACLSYEASFAFVLVPVALALATRRGLRAALRAAAPLLVLAIVFVGLTVHLRSVASAPDPAYAINLDPGLVLSTFAKQLVAAIPLDYIVLDPSHVPGGLPGHWSVGALFAAVVAFIAVLTLLGRAPMTTMPLPSKAGTAIRPRWLLPFVGLALWVLPAVSLALAPKYQHELVFGLGHLLVLIEDFGVGLLLGLGACALVERFGTAALRHRVWTIIFAALVATVIGVTWQSNQRVINIEAPLRDQRSLADEAGAAGLFHQLPAGATVVTDSADLDWPAVVAFPTYDWMPSNFFATHGATVDARLLVSVGQPGYYCFDDFGSGLPSCPPAPPPVYRVRVRSDTGGPDAVFVSKISAGQPLSAAELRQAPSSTTTLYVRGTRPFVVVGELAAHTAWRVSSAHLERVRSGPDWSIYTMPEVPVLPGTLAVVKGT